MCDTHSFIAPDRLPAAAWRAILCAFTFGVLMFPTAVLSRAQDVTDERERAAVERLTVRGMTRLYVEDLDGAGRAFEEALRIRPEDPALLASMSQVKIAARDYTSAEFFLQRAISNDPDSRFLWHMATVLYTASGQTSELIASYQRLLALNPEDLHAHVALVSLLIRVEDYPRAVSALDAAISIIGPLAALISLRADVLERLGQHSELEKTLRVLMAADPREPSHRLRLVASLIGRGDWTAAESELTALLVDDPDNEEAMGSLIDVLRHAGRNAEAANLLAQLEQRRDGVRADPRLTSDHASPEETRELASWIEQHPDDVDARFILAERLVDEGRFLEAADHYQGIVRTDPKRLDAWTAGIESFLSGDQSSRAIHMVEEALSLFPGYVPIRVLQLKALFASGQIERALEVGKDLETRQLSTENKETVASILRQIEAM